jgi:hypothetical protein
MSGNTNSTALFQQAYQKLADEQINLQPAKLITIDSIHPGDYTRNHSVQIAVTLDGTILNFQSFIRYSFTSLSTLTVNAGKARTQLIPEFPLIDGYCTQLEIGEFLVTVLVRDIKLHQKQGQDDVNNNSVKTIVSGDLSDLNEK